MLNNVFNINYVFEPFLFIEIDTKAASKKYL